MEESLLFPTALSLCGNNKAEMARRCGVTPATIFSWAAHLTPRAKLALEKLIRETKTKLDKEAAE